MEQNNNKNEKKLLNIFLNLKIIFIIVIILIYFHVSYSNNFIIKTMYNIQKNDRIINNVYINNKTLNDESEFFRYQNILPRLSPDPYYNNFSMKDIFNARQLYIWDNRITPNYIRYIRNINETEEQKYKKHFSENITKIEKNIFKKRIDQLDYKEFCTLALNEKLLENQKIENNNKPIISIIMPTYNKKKILLKSIRSIQNQNFKNIEIIIVNDCSNDNSKKVFDYLIETDPRIRIFHHMTNLGLFRSRLNGILYSRGKYIIAFDTGDFYEDNYVLLDAYNIMEKYKLDSCKFLFRKIITYNNNNLTRFSINYHVGINDKIEYGPNNIKTLDVKIFGTFGSIWNRLVRANIYIKGLLLLDELILNVYKNMWEDNWYNAIISNVSYSYAIIERIGYIYYIDGQGEGTPRFQTIEQKSKVIREYISFLYFDYNFCQDSSCKSSIIKQLKNYNTIDKKIQIKNLRSHFEVLNNLLEALIKDKDLREDDRDYCKKMLDDSKIREKEINKIKYRYLL